MASLTLGFHEHHPFLGTSDGHLDDNAGVCDHLLGLDSNLFGKLSGGGDDNGSDVVGFGALVPSGLLAELWVVLDDSLNDGDEETECFTGTSLCLRNAVLC